MERATYRGPSRESHGSGAAGVSATARPSLTGEGGQRRGGGGRGSAEGRRGRRGGRGRRALRARTCSGESPFPKRYDSFAHVAYRHRRACALKARAGGREEGGRAPLWS